MTARSQPPGTPLRVDVENEWVWCGERRLKLTPKAFAVLRYLAEHPRRLVTKDQLLGAVWPDTVVSEWALASCIGEIRKVLKDIPKAPQYIETVHRRGFRLIGPVVSSQHSVGSSLSFLPTPNPQSPSPALVGRDSELVQLHQWLEKAQNGERQIVFVTGEPGIGKTHWWKRFCNKLVAMEKYG